MSSTRSTARPFRVVTAIEAFRKHYPNDEELVLALRRDLEMCSRPRDAKTDNGWVRLEYPKTRAALKRMLEALGEEVS